MYEADIDDSIFTLILKLRSWKQSKRLVQFFQLICEWRRFCIRIIWRCIPRRGNYVVWVWPLSLSFSVAARSMWITGPRHTNPPPIHPPPQKAISSLKTTFNSHPRFIWEPPCKQALGGWVKEEGSLERFLMDLQNQDSNSQERHAAKPIYSFLSPDLT